MGSTQPFLMGKGLSENGRSKSSQGCASQESSGRSCENKKDQVAQATIRQALLQGYFHWLQAWIEEPTREHISPQIEGCTTKQDAWFYVGKKCAFVYKGKRYQASAGNKAKKSKIRAIWGKVTRPHGGSGAVRAKFTSNLPAVAMGHRVRIMLYPSNI